MSDILPKVSVWMTTHNQAAYVSEAVDSVLRQTAQAFEFIILDDASTDGTREILKRYARERPELIRLILNRNNVGIAAAKNAATSLVRGDYVTWLDGDDRFLPEKLKKEARLLSRVPEAGGVCSSVGIIDAAGSLTGLWDYSEAWSRSSEPAVDIRAHMFDIDGPIAHFRNEMMRVECFTKVGHYDENLTLWQDWELRIRLTRHCRFAYLPERLQDYRRHEGSASLRSENPLHVKDLSYVCRKHRAHIESLPLQRRKEARLVLAGKLVGWANRSGAAPELRGLFRAYARDYWRLSRSMALRFAFIAFVPPSVLSALRKLRLSLSKLKTGMDKDSVAA